MQVETKSSAVSNSDRQTVRFYQLEPELKAYLPLIRVGLDLLLSSWKFPPLSRKDVKTLRVWVSAEDARKIDYLQSETGKPAVEIVSAALIRAQHSNLRPPPVKPRYSAAAAE
jgi:hypothetical protein